MYIINQGSTIGKLLIKRPINLFAGFRPIELRPQNEKHFAFAAEID
jgi:hypothetical protein